MADVGAVFLFGVAAFAVSLYSGRFADVCFSCFVLCVFFRRRRVVLCGGVDFLLTKADKFPKTAGFIGGLSFVSPFYGSACVVALFLKKCKAAAFLALAFGAFIVAGAFSRYGASGFLEAFEGGIAALKENPCGFASVIGASACSGASPVLALVFRFLRLF